MASLRSFLVALAALASLAVIPQGARADSALVIVVENNDVAKTGGGSGFLRAMDIVGEPAYAAALRAAAAPNWDRVEVLIDDAARFESFAERLRALDAAGYTIDVVLDIHGGSAFTELDNSTSRGPDHLFFSGKAVTTAEVAALGARRKLRLNAVYMVSCWGSRFNEAWRAAGARAVNGSRELNYYVLLSPLVFVREFGRGADLEAAARTAYASEKALLDRSIVDRLLARQYGRAGAERIHGAESSSRIHAGPRVQAARIEERRTARAPTLF